MTNETKKPGRGGKRRNAGRRTELQGEAVKQTTVMLDDMTRRKLGVLGHGNISRAIRFCADYAYEKFQQDKLQLPADEKPEGVS